MPKMFGGGSKPKVDPSATAAGTKKLFSPEAIQKATGDYTKQGTAKWGQILSGMGAGGGTGGPDITQQIGSQASTMGEKLAELTDASGYGSGGNINDIMKQLEGGIGAKYNVFG
jgi:hypothetical protein